MRQGLEVELGGYGGDGKTGSGSESGGDVEIIRLVEGVWGWVGFGRLAVDVGVLFYRSSVVAAK